MKYNGQYRFNELEQLSRLERSAFDKRLRNVQRIVLSNDLICQSFLEMLLRIKELE